MGIFVSKLGKIGADFKMLSAAIAIGTLRVKPLYIKHWLSQYSY